MMAHGISIIIPTLNEERYIGRLLKALSPQLGHGDEIILVDSYSTDKTVSIARRYVCRVVYSPARGIAAAKNAGARKARGEIVAFLDADGYMRSNWLDRIRADLSDGSFSAVAGLDLYSSGGAGREMMYNAYSRFVFHSARLLYALGGKPWLPTNNCAMHSRLFKRIGGYANVLCEDAELMRRWPMAARVRYDGAMVMHLSDRRFRKYGFLSTLWLWAMADVKAWIGSGTDAKKYTRV